MLHFPLILWNLIWVINAGMAPNWNVPQEGRIEEERIKEEDFHYNGKFCQWDLFETGTKKDCHVLCTGTKGFIHPTEKDLICLDKEAIVGAVNIENNDGLFTCECVHDDSKEVFLCTPRIIFTTSNEEQCQKTCGLLTAYIYVKNKKIEVYCEQATNMNLYFLESFSTLVEHKTRTGKISRMYDCRCGVGLNEFKKRDRNSKLKKKLAERIYKNNGYEEMALECQFKRLPMPKGKRENYCRNRCSWYMGYVTDNNQLLCYHRIDTTMEISEGNERCECGYKARMDTTRVTHHCQPKLVFPSIANSDACKSVCPKYTTLRIFNQYKKMESLWCGIIFNPDNVILSLDWKLVVNDEAADSNRFADCSCGVKSLTNRETLISGIEMSDQNNELSDIKSTDLEVSFVLNGKHFTKKRNKIGSSSDSQDNSNDLANSGKGISGKAKTGKSGERVLSYDSSRADDIILEVGSSSIPSEVRNDDHILGSSLPTFSFPVTQNFFPPGNESYEIPKANNEFVQPVDVDIAYLRDGQTPSIENWTPPSTLQDFLEPLRFTSSESIFPNATEIPNYADCWPQSTKKRTRNN